MTKKRLPIVPLADDTKRSVLVKAAKARLSNVTGWSQADLAMSAFNARSRQRRNEKLGRVAYAKIDAIEAEMLEGLVVD